MFVVFTFCLSLFIIIIYLFFRTLDHFLAFSVSMIMAFSLYKGLFKQDSNTLN